MLVYDRAIQEFDYPSACVIALVNIALSVGLYSLYRRLLGRLGRG
jgi:2-aminoethylphosphonate transport system permease protein